MAYRRRQGIPRESTFKEEIYHARPAAAAAAAADVLEDSSSSSSTSSSSSSLAARAIRASAAHRDSSAYGYAYATPATDSHSSSPSFLCRDSPVLSASKGSGPFDSTSMKDSDDSKYGFWGILARKAKSILDDENDPQQLGIPNRMKAGATNAPHRELFNQPQSPDSGGKMESPKLRKGLNAITSSLNHIGDTIGNALEEGRVIVENKTAGIIQETRKLQSRRKGPISEFQNQNLNLQNSWQQPGVQPMQKPAQTDQETQLKASRDVAMATAAKAKLLLRELKTTKADLAFAKERCAQLEEENKRLRESKEKGGNTIADDDLIRLQLETLLAEKARLAHENSIYARENRFLREIVEYHQLTMQDLVYFDEGREVVDTVYPFSINDAGVLSNSSTSPTSPESLPDVSPSMHPTEISESTKEISSSDCALDSKELIEAVDFRKESEDHQNNQAASISRVQFPMAKDAKSPTVLSS
ncbi:hypothetical protein Drorol1_Dr00009048 [Drosera rotundifolia]